MRHEPLINQGLRKHELVYVLQPLVIMQNTQQYLQKKIIDMHITVLLVQNALFHETKV